MKRLTLLFTLLSMLSLPLLAGDAKPVKGQFEIGKGTFLLNGEPIVIKAAEMHYTRIPKPYWEHRIQLCKALGMNSICLYVFWNIHEQEMGAFDFEGQNDIAEFCRIAQANDMLVIVRPGPYVCAEWEMGGLPWWLLKKQDIKLRSTDSFYMNRVARFMDELGKELADLQITRGGNIIMVQVENEFGAYGTDKPYVSAIRDQVRASGFNEVPLFQCDWASNFENNGLDDLLWTVNFGTGANIDKQFERLKSVRPDSPLMCSEFWSGWFDHWGRKHETRDATQMVNGLRDMLDRDISFSLYMTHGGTTFGHWGGANSPSYTAMCSSYDYDAPIGEWGNVTPKYHKLRSLMANYLDQGEVLSEIPDSIPTMAIDNIKIHEIAPLFENLPKQIRSHEVKPMEEFDQGWGTILYRTTLEEAKTQEELRIDELCDWGQIYLDGELLGYLDRRNGERSITIPAHPAGATLDILVEAMGRVNFGQAIHDRKGITEKVVVRTRNYTKELKDWEVYSYLPQHDFVVKNNNFRPFLKKEQMPAYYRGTFNLTERADTFIDLSKWGKGMVWVNGYAIGRFWEIGPQQTLYMPGCWLKEGENEIIVLDLLPSSSAELKGLKLPILDVLNVKQSAKHREEGQTLRLKGEKAVHKASFAPGNGWQEVNFAKQQKGRYFAIEALSSQQGDKHASIAELEIKDAEGNHISRKEWKIVYADSEEALKANNTADKVFDLQESTFWHTEFSEGEPSDFPHHIVIDLGEEYTISGFSYLPRAESNYPGMIKDYRVFVKKKPFKL